MRLPLLIDFCFFFKIVSGFPHNYGSPAKEAIRARALLKGAAFFFKSSSVAFSANEARRNEKKIKD